MENKFNVNVRSEIGELEAVILHTPGTEVENMTPENAERALYSDILNLSVASSEYAQLKGTLSKFAKIFEVKDLLTSVLENEKVKEDLLSKICENEHISNLKNALMRQDTKNLAGLLIEGVFLEKNNLTDFLNRERYSLKPLHNFFFTRDASACWTDRVIIGRMASRVRDREALIMETIFDYHKNFNSHTLSANNRNNNNSNIRLEGGDILIAREDIILMGIGARTTSQGVDFILQKLTEEKKEKCHIIVQELPLMPESFIHLDMVFTFLDKDKCMVYEPVILKPNKLQTVHIEIDNGKVKNISHVKNIPDILRQLGIDLTPVLCGGNSDEWVQEREQWHSGANFFALAPGKVIGYGRNVHTIEELNKNGFEVIKAKDIIGNKVSADEYQKAVITIQGSELARGGGGARCMTMPVRRKPVSW